MTQDHSSHSIEAAKRNPAMMAAAQALFDNRLSDAEPLLKGQLKQDPFDVAAMRMLAELAGRIGRNKDAENLLRRALELAPEFMAARSNLATALYRQNRPVEALAELDSLQLLDPENAGNANLKAAAHGRLGDYQEALELYEQILANHPNQPKVWMSYGHVLKTVGRLPDSIAAYRRSIAIAPTLGETWWSLANLKTVKFTQDDITAMTAALEAVTLQAEDRFHLHFALGKAFEDRKQADKAFYHYTHGNELRSKALDYDPAETTAHVARVGSLFTPAFVAGRSGQGFAARDPIFVVGMPRSGSTLIEQILSSHSMVEGTSELADIPALAARIGARDGGLASVDADEAAALGQEYLERTRVQRKSDKPHFIDKLPNNWMHVGFINLILPNAKIIDARRNPMDCCFSNFKQHFARGQGFAYDLAHMGHYYRDYVTLMEHFDDVLPGRVHRVIHEHLIEDTDGQVQAMLEYLGLPFEDACLRFWETDRAVRTPSSEQVRRPINRDGVDIWRDYETWLTPLKEALGDIVTRYPA